jgi:hypothetical protein
MKLYSRVNEWNANDVIKVILMTDFYNIILNQYTLYIAPCKEKF